MSVTSTKNTPNGPIKYIKNKDLLLEIHNSKNTFCSYIDPIYSKYDTIIHDVSEIPSVIELAKTKRASSLSTKEIKVLPEDISVDDLVFRVMTADHIPDDPLRKRRGKGLNEMQAKTNFPSFKHYILKDNVPFEVGRSHWKGGLQNGEFCVDHGKINNRLAMMFLLLVERYSNRVNWRGYSYVDEMRNHALLQLSQIGLQFDESKSDNPFAFFTTVITNCFTRVLNLEKRNHLIRDDLLIMSGAMPSFGRQIEDEFQQKSAPAKNEDGDIIEPVEIKYLPKRGRKPANMRN